MDGKLLPMDFDRHKRFLVLDVGVGDGSGTEDTGTRTYDRTNELYKKTTLVGFNKMQSIGAF
jgi:hypothetical protein